MASRLDDLIREHAERLDQLAGPIDLTDVIHRPRNDATALALIDTERTAAQLEGRRRWLMAAAAAAAIVLVVGVLVVSARQDPAARVPAASSAGAPERDLGLFEPVRGWIIYAGVNGLMAVDPGDPTSQRTLDVPDALATPRRSDGNLTPAGWSADGSKLALTDEYNGDLYVMDSSGAVTAVPNLNTGCCAFVADPWLSPDGTTALGLVAPATLRLVDLTEPAGFRTVQLHPPNADPEWEFVLPAFAWSPDASQIAYASYRRDDRQPDSQLLVPSIHIVDLTTDTTRQLVGESFGHIRQIAWSPDGSQLLVIAGSWQHPRHLPTLNPLTQPHATSLYLVDVNDAEVTEIATGSYVAVSWSPDASQIAAIDYSAAGRSLVVMNADGTAARTLAELPADLFTGVAWQPTPYR